VTISINILVSLIGVWEYHSISVLIKEIIYIIGSNWEKSHEIPDGKSSINSFASLVNQNKEVLRTILSGTFDDFYDRTRPSSGHLPDPEKLIDKQNFEKVKDLYDSCMNEAKIDARGSEPIYPVLKELHNLFPTSSNDFMTRRLTQTLSFLAKRDIGALFEIMVEADPKDPSVNALQLYQSGLTLPNKVYYTQEETVQVLYETIAETLSVIYNDKSDLASGMFKGNNVNATARLIVEFEKKLAEISQLPEFFQDPEATYNPMTLSELAKIAPNVDWGLYVTHLLPPTAPHPGKLVVTSPAFIGNVSTELLEKESTRTLQAYFTWKIIFSYADALGEDVRTPIRRLTSKLIGTNPKSIKPRWDTCLDEVNGDLGFLAGRYYVLDKFGGNAKERADEFVNSIKDVFLERLPKLEWIDQETREKAEEKVDKLIRKVGYPDTSPNVMSPVSLSNFYADLSMDADDYFINYVNARKFGVLDQWRRVGKTPDRSKWLMNPQEVNAYYNPSFNEVY
jgi:endothelin-converting enzyme